MIIFTSITDTMKIVKKISDEVESEGNDTQQAILKSVHLTLFPEARAAGKSHTFLAVYNDLLSCPKYHSRADRIASFLAEKLSLRTNDNDEEKLKKHIGAQTDDILGSRAFKFVDFLIFLSYESKETLIKANILPESAKKSKKDAAELISELVQSRVLTLNNLYEFSKKYAANDDYKSQILKILRCPEWTAIEGYHFGIKTEAISLSFTSPSKFGDTVEPDSPNVSPQSCDKNWTAPVGMKSISDKYVRVDITFPSEISSSKVHEFCKDICLSVRKTILTRDGKASRRLSYTDSIPEAAFHSSKHQATSLHAATISDSGLLTCTVKPASVCSEITELHQIWLEGETSSRDNAGKFN